MFCLLPVSRRRHCAFLAVLRSTLPSLRMLSGAPLLCPQVSSTYLSRKPKSHREREGCAFCPALIVLFFNIPSVSVSPVFICPSTWATLGPVQLSTLPTARGLGLTQAWHQQGPSWIRCFWLKPPRPPHAPSVEVHPLQELQVMFLASVSLFKQNALVFLVLRSCGLPLLLQLTGSHRFIVHFFAVE